MTPPDRMLADLYRTLGPTERSRLVARLVRDDAMTELRLVRDTVPEAHRDAYNHALHTAAHMPLPLVGMLEALRYALEQARGEVDEHVQERRRRALAHRHLLDLWRALPYPITQSEYAALIALERAEPRPLDELAQFIAQSFSADDAPTVCPAVAAWLTTPDEDAPTSAPGVDVAGPDDTPWDWRPAAAEARALLGAAIAAGELPTPTQAPTGPAVPWGPFTDWLYHRDSGAYTPAGPNHHVAAVYLLAGLFARWDVRPDAEQAAVTRRRAELVGALAGLADLPPTLRPSPHPPASLADRARQQAQVEAAWPWQPGPDEDARAVALSYLYGSVRREIHALADAVATVQRDIFGGEDPLHPRVRASLAGLLEADALTRAWWDAIAAAPLWSEDHPWPAPATYDEHETAARVAEFLQVLADR